MLERPVKITYGSGEVETFSYDKWGKLVATTRGDQKATYQYDFFGRLTQKTENNTVNRYTYNQWGQRTSRETVDGAVTLSEKRSYDKLGRLTAIDSGTGKIEYSYNDKNQLARQTVNGIAIDFTYTKYGQLAGKYLGGQAVPMAKLQYFYSKDGMITGRMVDNELQNYTYDQKGQLLTVATADGKVVESYKYDPAGNILAKTVNGVTTAYTYDAANQLKSSITDKKSTNFAYDAAGRLVKENNKVYQYSGLDKVTNILEGEKVISSYNYSISGQLASATTDGATENFLWDGLALIRRGDTDYTNEPYVTGGNPVVAGDKVLFNDILGNTVGIKSEDKLKLIQMTAFGETADKDAFFTGKPAVNNLGYSFLFRNYRADQGKWLSSDPLGYPDGWNNLAYVNNSVVCYIDYLGREWVWAVCQRPVGADNNHTWIEGHDDSTNTTVTYSGLTQPGEPSSGSGDDGGDTQGPQTLDLYKDSRADAVPAWGTDNSVQIPMPGGMDGKQFGDALEGIFKNYPQGTIPYGVLTMGSDDYNCNSLTASILATIGVPGDIIDGIASSLPGGHWGWGTRLPAGVLRE